MADTMYTVSSSPHIRSNDSIDGIMKDVIIALLPATLAGVYFFGVRALIIIIVSILSCVGAEAGYQKLTGQKITISDYSAAVTGLLLAFNLPATVPFWIPVIGGFFAIIIVKQFFGGLGQNFMNPALAGRAFLLASYPVLMTTWPTVDGVSSATPLGLLKESSFIPAAADYMSALFGNISGSIGETSALALLLGGGYLLYKRVINWKIPVTYIGTVFILTAIFGRQGLFGGYPLYEVLIGGLMLGAFFMATDYSSSPVTEKGQYIMGIGCGVLTAIIRVYGGYPEGVSYSILLMNLAVPLIDRYTQPRIFGEVK